MADSYLGRAHETTISDNVTVDTIADPRELLPMLTKRFQYENNPEDLIRGWLEASLPTTHSVRRIGGQVWLHREVLCDDYGIQTYLGTTANGDFLRVDFTQNTNPEMQGTPTTTITVYDEGTYTGVLMDLMPQARDTTTMTSPIAELEPKTHPNHTTDIFCTQGAIEALGNLASVPELASKIAPFYTTLTKQWMP